jgi:CheY-like chemotaxis protein
VNTEVAIMMTQTKVMRVLVVDDERVVCNGVEKILARKGHTVEQTLSVADAVKAIERNPEFDMILADLMMPQAGGLDMVRIAKDRWPGIPVIIMTGYASIGSAIEATRAGAAGYLPKPFTPEELESTIERVTIVMNPRPKAKPAPIVLPKAKQIIDVDMPFDADEVAAATSPEYVKHLTRSDVALVDYCDLGDRSCKRFKAKGACQQPECPLVVAERRKKAPVAIAAQSTDFIDVDMPFSFAEVASATSEAYADALGRGDMPLTGRWSAEKATGRKVLVIDDEVVAANRRSRAARRSTAS